MTAEEQPISQIKLGKRNSEQEEDGEALSLNQLEQPSLASFIQQSYKYFLPLLSHTANNDYHPFEAYITTMIQESQKLLLQKLESN